MKGQVDAGPMSFDPIASVSSTGFKSPAGVHLEPFSKKSAAEMAEEMRSGYLRMKTDDYASVGGGGGDDLIRSDLQELGVAARKLANHALMVVGGLGSGTTFFKLLATFAAMSVLLDFVSLLSPNPLPPFV